MFLPELKDNLQAAAIKAYKKMPESLREANKREQFKATVAMLDLDIFDAYIGAHLSDPAYAARRGQKVEKIASTKLFIGAAQEKKIIDSMNKDPAMRETFRRTGIIFRSYYSDMRLACEGLNNEITSTAQVLKDEARKTVFMKEFLAFMHKENPCIGRKQKTAQEFAKGTSKVILARGFRSKAEEIELTQEDRQCPLGIRISSALAKNPIRIAPDRVIIDGKRPGALFEFIYGEYIHGPFVQNATDFEDVLE